MDFGHKRMLVPEPPHWEPANNGYEHRSRDEAYVKVYEQRRMVGYADYKVGMFYIAPGDVVDKP